MSVPGEFGRYLVECEIGDGSMGRVYRAFDPLMQRTVAVKTIKTEYLSRDSAEDYLRRFRREAHAAGRLSHPNIVSLFDVGENYFVMEYLDGMTLQQLLQRQGKLPLEEALALLAPLADALDYAHSEGVIHRDIKPANIMVLPDGRPKLMDFGVARLESSAATATGQFFGSPSYMAPEQVAGPRSDSRADVFALSVVAYEMITGHRPFEGETITAVLYRVVHEPAPPPCQWDFELPPVYNDIFRRALAKKPEDRYQTAAAVVAALQLKDVDAIFDDLPVSPAPPLEAGADGPAPPAGRAATATPSGKHPLPALDATPVPAAPDGAQPEETHDLRGGTADTPLRRARMPAAALAVLLAASVAIVLGLRRNEDDAGFRIEAVPHGATVWVDGVAVGQAPVRLAALPAGPHRVRVTRDGYAPAELGFDLPQGTAPPPLRFSLQKLEPPPTPEPEPEPEATAPPPPRPAASGGRGPRPSPTPTPPLVREGQLVALDRTVTPPRQVSGSSPSYPAAARRLKLLGSVRVDMIIDEHGVPLDPRVVESAGVVLDEVVLDAVKGFRYEPARKHGVPVRVRWSYRHSFVAP